MSAISGAGGPGGPRDLLGALRDGRIQGDEERLRVATQLMEGQFYQVLFSAMRDTVPGDGLMSGGQGEEMFTDMLDQQLADHAAGNMESGLGAALYRHFVGHVRGDADAAPADAGPTDPTRLETEPAVATGILRDDEAGA